MRYFSIAAAVLLTLSVISACHRYQPAQGDVVLDSAGKAVSAKDAPVIKFDEEIYDFGTITEGETVKYEFSFKNTGKTPLIISNAMATCGCTEPEYPTKPIKPGDKGVIKVAFNSTGRLGIQDKVVTLVSNANPAIATLHIVGEVKEKK